MVVEEDGTVSPRTISVHLSFTSGRKWTKRWSTPRHPTSTDRDERSLAKALDGTTPTWSWYFCLVQDSLAVHDRSVDTVIDLTDSLGDSPAVCGCQL